MKRSITRLMASATIFFSLSFLFQNCGPAKVSTDGVDTTVGSSELGSNSGDQQQPSGSNPPVATPVPTATPSSGTNPTPGATPTPIVTPTPTPVVTPAPTQGPSLKASVAFIDFGDVEFGLKSRSRPVTLTNVGDANVTFSSKTIVGSDFGMDSFGITTCGNTLAPGASCDIGVYYSPFFLGPSTGMLRVNSNEPNSPTLIQLEGNATFF